MNRISLLFVWIVGSLIFSSCKNQQGTEAATAQAVAKGEDNVAYKIGALALVATANDTEKFNPRPTITSRYLGLIFTAVFDAWSRFDEQATPVYLADVERRPVAEQTEENKKIAICYAAYRAMNEYFFSDSLLFRQFMQEQGLNPDDASLDPNTPVGIGNLAALAVIEARKNDGSNQYGEEEGSDGTPYFNYVNYTPVNSVDKNVDPNRWQPKYFSDGKGGRFAPACLTPYWDKVKPLGLKSADQFRPGPPPMIGSEQLEKEVREVIELQAHLTDEQKALVEFMRDGPKSVQQAGHWLKFAQDVSRRDQHTLDEDVKMYFLNQMAAMDAFIAAWDTKMYYDFARPYALVHQYYEDQVIKAWGGPGKGMVDMKGNQWRPYSPETFLCPPFPSYVSGHSCVSGACSEILKLYTGSDAFGEKVELVAGALTDPDHLGEKVTLEFPTFTETANMAGISRVLGGYHIQADNVAGLQLGRDVAHEVWKFYLKHIGKEPSAG
ncbi:MAG TPA: vanadium-dependent haloperoxidase [Saprospiraceae bacterium]|nr:vanadium-dependent haloperoxidase [Saprospiraceae bacterium]HMQ85422.1 vanadium-dependent haloperoxidase [Saprospiraceae bacterium]